MNKVLTVFTDGGARGNPGEAAIGVYITDQNKNQIVAIGKRIGVATNNVAEYTAVIEALTWIHEHKQQLTTYSRIAFFLDSLLVCSQINGLYKMKNAILRSLLFTIRELEATISIPIVYSHVPREKNKQADKLVNKALDG